MTGKPPYDLLARTRRLIEAVRHVARPRILSGGSLRSHERAWHPRCRILPGDQLVVSAFIRLRRKPGPAYSAVVAFGYEGWIRPWMNGIGGPSEARRAKEGASVDFAEEMKGLRAYARGGFMAAGR